jgi:hypothetical protein
MKPLDIRRFMLSLAISALAAFFAVPAARAQEEDEFQPRTSAPPANRTGGASRGGSPTTKPPTVSVLAPAKTAGLTTREQPVVYWSISEATDHPVVVTLTDPAKLDESAETTITGPIKAGVQKLEFASLKQDGKPVTLKPGVKYELVVEVVVKKTGGGSENPAATCRIVRMDPKEAAAFSAAAEKEQDLVKRASAYAKEGVWFDYIDALNAAIEKKPDDETLLQRRAKALAAQGLVSKPDGTVNEKNGRSGAPPKQ